MHVHMVLNGRVVVSRRLALCKFCACSVKLLVSILCWWVLSYCWYLGYSISSLSFQHAFFVSYQTIFHHFLLGCIWFRSPESANSSKHSEKHIWFIPFGILGRTRSTSKYSAHTSRILGRVTISVSFDSTFRVFWNPMTILKPHNSLLLFRAVLLLPFCYHQNLISW